jgi:hypothetical protein
MEDKTLEDEKKVGDTISPEAHPTDAALPDSAFNADDAEAPEAELHQGDTQVFAEVKMHQELPSTDAAPSSAQADLLPVDVDCLKWIEERLESITGTEQRLFSEVREMHKLYHSEFAGRLKVMQDELEQYRKIDKGRAYDDILAAIARIYGNNETLAEEVAEPKAKKSIRYMLMDIEDLLGVYGMEKLRSEPGEKRNPRHCQILGRIPTDDPAKHDTVAKSYNSGFHIGNRTVIKEVVDIYLYEGAVPIVETDEGHIIEAGDTPVTE